MQTTTFSPLSSSSKRAQDEPLRAPTLVEFKRHEHMNFRSFGLWRIHEGYVRTLTWNLEGEPVPLGFWTRRDVVGYPIAQVNPYEAQCLTAVKAEYLGLGQGLSQEMALAQVRQSSDLLRIAHCRNAQQRVVQFACWLAGQFGLPVAEGRQIQLRLTHQEMAESLGLTRVTVTRLLKALEQAGKIRWTPREKVVYHETFEQSYEYLCDGHRQPLGRDRLGRQRLF